MVGFCRRDGGATSAYAVAAVPRPTKRLKRRLREEKEGRYAAEAQVLRLQVELERAREEIHRLRSAAEARQLPGPRVAARSRKATAVPEHAFRERKRKSISRPFNKEKHYLLSKKGVQHYKGHQTLRQLVTPLWEIYSVTTSADEKRQMRSNVLRDYIQGGGGFYKLNPDTEEEAEVYFDQALDLTADVFRYMCRRFQKSMRKGHLRQGAPFHEERDDLFSKSK